MAVEEIIKGVRAGHERALAGRLRLPNNKEGDMGDERTDIETGVLAGLCSDRYMLTKAVDDGFRPELLHSPAAKIAATALPQLKQQSTGSSRPVNGLRGLPEGVCKPRRTNPVSR